MNTDLMVRGPDYQTLKLQAQDFIKSGMLPDSIRTAEACFAIAVKGLEVGMPPMQAFAQINVIKGKPVINAEGMQYLIRKNCPKARIEIVERTTKICRIRATRPNEIPVEFTWTIEDAKTAGLLANATWTKFPRNMLFARCVSDMARSVFADCIGGISYTPEELGAVVDEDGNMIEEPKVIVVESVAAPVEDVAEVYDPNNNVHKKSLAVIAAKYLVTDLEKLRELSREVAGKDFATIEQVMKKKMEIIHDGSTERS